MADHVTWLGWLMFGSWACLSIKDILAIANTKDPQAAKTLSYAVVVALVVRVGLSYALFTVGTGHL